MYNPMDVRSQTPPGVCFSHDFASLQELSVDSRRFFPSPSVGGSSWGHPVPSPSRERLAMVWRRHDDMFDVGKLICCCLTIMSWCKQLFVRCLFLVAAINFRPSSTIQTLEAILRFDSLTYICEKISMQKISRNGVSKVWLQGGSKTYSGSVGKENR